MSGTDPYDPCKDRYTTRHEGNVCLVDFETCPWIWLDRPKVYLLAEFEPSIKKVIENCGGSFYRCGKLFDSESESPSKKK